MTHDSSGSLRYTRDVTEPISTPDFQYSNPHHQRVGPRWVRGEVVYALPLGIVSIDPERQTWANEYVLVYQIVQAGTFTN